VGLGETQGRIDQRRYRKGEKTGQPEDSNTVARKGERIEETRGYVGRYNRKTEGTAATRGSSRKAHWGRGSGETRRLGSSEAKSAGVRGQPHKPAAGYRVRKREAGQPAHSSTESRQGIGESQRPAGPMSRYRRQSVMPGRIGIPRITSNPTKHGAARGNPPFSHSQCEEGGTEFRSDL